MWLAHYKGMFSSTETGSFRLVGWGDNVMIVKVGSNLVFDASDVGYTGHKREAAGGVSFPKKDGTQMFHGQWLELRAGEAKNIDVLLGDEGGIFCAGLIIQKQGTDYAPGQGGIPDLPVFCVGALTEPEKKLLRAYLPEKSLAGPVFPAKAGGASSLLDSLKKP